ncbi:CLUMA_CG018696, isoform B [Clunio marinus]|uniref:CLUMA_CG018696, isoform B n=1 Tax=Clunio marinus TaxID=568069 RepID=A0A1J1IZU8_9DIPT|nr:CLUMA_CG018696, isoform B [Clunio marinus]
MLGVSRRGVSAGPPLSMDETGNNWKGNGQGSDAQNSGSNFGGGPNNANNFSSGPVFPQSNQGSPAGNMQPNSFQGPPPGSNTPQYTASPAPSGSSTPGPGPPTSSGFPPPPQNSSGPPYNGPAGSGPFGSPSSNGPQFGRPGSSGPAFGPQFGPGGPNNFVGGGPPFMGPSGSPFHGQGHPMGGPGHMMSGPQPVDRLDPRFHISSGLNVGRRHSYFGQPDYRIYELNKRLQQRTDESDNCWWDSFANEFFEDDAQLTLTFCLEDGPKRYTIGRTLIPRYFRSIFEGGVTELYYNLKHSKESFHNTSITLDCEQCTMVTHHSKPMYTKVCTEGRLVLEFTFDDLMRIKTWHMAVRAHREMIPRNIVGMHTHPSQSDPAMLEQLSKNITRQGITNSTLNYLRLCVILEPMQELMSRHKAYSLSPRDCLKTTLFQKWQRMVAPPDAQRPANKRRKRKGSSGGGVANSTPPVPNKKRSPGPNFSLASQDVMVVGEPSLMGGEFGDEDERLITRLENTQYDGTNSLDHDNHGFGHAESPLSNANSWVDRGGGSAMNQQNNSQASQDAQDKKSPVVPPQ